MWAPGPWPAAAPDTVDGTPLEDEVEATIVPVDDVDEFPLEAHDNFQLLCDGRLVLTLEAPAGMALRLEVRDGDDVLGQATSADLVPGAVTIREERRLGSDDGKLTAVVTPAGSDRVGDPYVLRREGSF